MAEVCTNEDAESMLERGKSQQKTRKNITRTCFAYCKIHGYETNPVFALLKSQQQNVQHSLVFLQISVHVHETNKKDKTED